MTLGDAIAAVEQSETARVNAHNQTTNDQGAADALQAKVDAAKSVVTGDQALEVTANAAEVAALQVLQTTVADLITQLKPPAAPVV